MSQSHWIRIGKVSDLPPGHACKFRVETADVAVFNVAGEFQAVNDRCPHRGASLAEGTVADNHVSCPLHGWSFDLATGECFDRPAARLDRFRISVDGDDLLLDTSSLAITGTRSSDGDGEQAPAAGNGTAPAHNGDGIYRYLIRYGALGWVATFGSVHKLACAHKERVVVQTERGLEIGEVLVVPDRDGNDGVARRQPTGEVVRKLTEPERKQQAGFYSDVPAGIAEYCHRVISQRSVPVEIVDGELLFDGETVVFYFLGEQSEELGPVGAELGLEYDKQILFHPLVEPEPQAAAKVSGCGSGGCGSCH